MRQGSNGRRPRGRSYRRQHGGSPRGNNSDSNGPEGRVRGNAHQVYEKYVGMARDALASGDRLAAETYYQHAEHYYRIVNASTDPQPDGQGGRQPRQSGNGRMDGVAQATPQDGANGADGGEQPRAAEGRGDRQKRRDSKPEPKPVVEAEAAPEVEAEPAAEAEPKEPSPDETAGA